MEKVNMVTLQDVIAFIYSPGLTPADRDAIVNAVNDRGRMFVAQAKAQFRPGQSVQFFSRKSGTLVKGTVAAVNRKNIDVLATGGMRWRVSPQLLKPA